MSKALGLLSIIVNDAIELEHVGFLRAEGESDQRTDAYRYYPAYSLGHWHIRSDAAQMLELHEPSTSSETLPQSDW
jgi:hypothetical protein